MLAAQSARYLKALAICGAAAAFVAPGSGPNAAGAEDGGRLLIAEAGSWEKYKRIRQGEATLDDPPPDSGQAASSSTPAATTAQAGAREATQPSAPPAVSADEPSSDQKGGTHRAQTRPTARPVSAPEEPDQTGSWWAFYAGRLDISSKPYYDPHGVDFRWAYSRKNPLPENPRIVVSMHGSGAGEAAMGVFGPSEMGDIEVRNQDAEAHNPDWREWWTFGPDGQPYPGRRIAATLEFLRKRYWIDPAARGIVLEGPSMGGAGAVIQTMILPDPWREMIAWSSARVGVIMPRRIAQNHPGQYPNFPPDNSRNRALWDAIDFEVQAARDALVRGIHYRHAFSSDDQFSDGPEGNSQLEFVNLVERHRIGGAFSWVKGGHSTYERGMRMPDLSRFEVPEQDVTLDRAHPAITESTGNFPATAAQRVDEKRFPRGHYNLGITWDHAAIVDTHEELVFPLKYKRRTGFGKGVPDQPATITVNVTPRRPRNFALRDGETLQWRWDSGARSGTAKVHGDVVTAEGIPLVSGEDYKLLRFYR